MYLKSAIAALAVSMLAIPVLAAELDTYTNARYGYSISYPGDLVRPLPESDSGDGRIFRAKSGAAEFRVFANGFDDVELIAKSAEENCSNRKASYRVVRPTMVAVSCETAGGSIIYSKAWIRDGMATTMTAAYPKAESRIWNEVVSTMSKTMRAAR